MDGVRIPPPLDEILSLTQLRDSFIYIYYPDVWSQRT